MPFYRYLVALFGVLLLTACGGEPPIGPDESLLYGTWAQDGITQADPSVTVSDGVITYAPNGVSSFTGVMTFYQPGQDPIRFDIAADVNWVLEETIITRTLKEVTITPQIPSEGVDAIAEAFEEAYRASPPGRLIVQYVNPTELIVLDADAGIMLRYLKQPPDYG